MRAAPPRLGARVGTLLGTPIFDLDVAMERDVRIVSDLHLRPDTGAATQAFEALLDRIAGGGLALVLGDLFDYWVGRPQLRQPAWGPVLDAIRRATGRGVRVYVLHGNRDFQLEGSFERATGARVVAGGLRLAAPGHRPLLCLHGDELCQNDIRYQRSKRWLRSRPVRLSLHAMPFAVSRRLAHRARAVSKASLATADPASLRPSAGAIEAVRGLGPADVLFGHIHVAERGPVPGAGDALEFFVLPAFDAALGGHAVWTPGSVPRLVRNGNGATWPAAGPLGP